jgi:hypothetical protein
MWHTQTMPVSAQNAFPAFLGARPRSETSAIYVGTRPVTHSILRNTADTVPGTLRSAEMS